MDFMSTVKGSMLEGFYPAGWDMKKIDKCCQNKPEDITKPQKFWNKNFSPVQCNDLTEFDTKMGHEIANEIKKAKERGIKFTFGTNNVDANFGRLEYCFEAVEKCGITVEDMWFPTMSVRRERPVVIYNHFDASGKRVK